MEMELLVKPSIGISKSITREKIMEFESQLLADPCAVDIRKHCPAKHSFADGIYIREVFIPAGTLYTGKIHKQDHPRFLLQGELTIATEEGLQDYKAPCYLVTTTGTKRAGYCKKDAILVTVHANPSNTRDLEEIEKMLTADSYQELEQYVEQKKYLTSNQEKGITNCGILSLNKISELKNITAATLVALALDNGINLKAYSIPAEELKNIPRPAIFHSENHFCHVGKEDAMPDLKYSGIVLSQDDLDFEKVKTDDLKNINGGTFFVAGAALVTAGAGIFASTKNKQAAEKAANSNEAVAAAQAKAQQDANTALLEAAILGNKPAANNTMLYVGIGVGVLLLTGIIILVVTRKKQ